MLVGRVVRIVCVSSLCLAAVLAAAGGLGRGMALGAEGSDRQRERSRIAALLEAMERSGLTFIREGKEYSGTDARKHLARKLRYAGQRVKTAEEFIEEVASRSSTTGRPYLVRLPGGKVMESGEWLPQKLRQIDARR